MAAASADARPNLSFTVLVYNYAAIPPEVLAQTEAEVARLYARGAIEIVWLDCPLSAGETGHFPACRVPQGPTWLALRILPQSMAEHLPRAIDSLGSAFCPDNGSFGTFATAFAHEVEQLASRRRIGQEIIFGQVVAHELAHLLLGAGSHSPSGIMHASWHIKEMQIIAQKQMMFTAPELEKMRSNLRLRMAAEKSRTSGSRVDSLRLL